MLGKKISSVWSPRRSPKFQICMKPGPPDCSPIEGQCLMKLGSRLRWRLTRFRCWSSLPHGLSRLLVNSCLIFQLEGVGPRWLVEISSLAGSHHRGMHRDSGSAWWRVNSTHRWSRRIDVGCAAATSRRENSALRWWRCRHVGKLLLERNGVTGTSGFGFVFSAVSYFLADCSKRLSQVIYNK